MTDRKIKFRTWLGERYGGFGYWGFIKEGEFEMGFTGLPVGKPRSFEDSQKATHQFTGMKDKKGQDIYVGDIVEVGIIDPGPRKVPGTITFTDGCFEVWFFESIIVPGSRSHICQTRDYLKVYVAGDVEVIGNVYENPELME